mmetsp:Transcript_220/g.839  ORF Transcript_220/g.839 Transcript_220/m.839 type:complete len:213 (+) Transcript_220:3216-3854(+)
MRLCSPIVVPVEKRQTPRGIVHRPRGFVSAGSVRGSHVHHIAIRRSVHARGRIAQRRRRAAGHPRRYSIHVEGLALVLDFAVILARRVRGTRRDGRGRYRRGTDGRPERAHRTRRDRERHRHGVVVGFVVIVVVVGAVKERRDLFRTAPHARQRHPSHPGILPPGCVARVAPGITLIPGGRPGGTRADAQPRRVEAPEDQSGSHRVAAFVGG